MPLQVLPTRTFSVNVCVCALIGPDSTSNASIWVRAGGARSAIGATFKLLLVGQPFGPGANVAAIPTAATTASISAAAPAITTRLAVPARRNRGCQENRSMVPSSVVGSPLCALRQANTMACPDLSGTPQRSVARPAREPAFERERDDRPTMIDRCLGWA